MQLIDQELAALLSNWRSALTREAEPYGESIAADYSSIDGHHAVLTLADGREQIVEWFADRAAAESYCHDYRESMGW